jgi:predicted nuclease of predicted toxin-antitoxin system
VGLPTAADRTILDDAAANNLVIVSADTDFGEMLGFADTIFGQTPRIWRATHGRHGLPAVARGRVG